MRAVFRHIFWLILVGTLAATTAIVADETDRSLIQASTARDKGFYHVVFTETIRSREQRDWKGPDAYRAAVEVFRDGHSIGHFRGSTLPNFAPGSGKPADWKYAVVQATCAFPSELKPRYYTWSRGRRADGVRPCLRLSDRVPTVNVSSERAATLTFPELVALFDGESQATRYLRFATNILVHSGQNNDWRGSAGCLTIHPDDATRFFSLIAEGTTGTLELNRAIEDAATKSTHCY